MSEQATRAWPREVHPRLSPGALAMVVVGLALVTAALSLHHVTAASRVPLFWPVPGLLGGVLLVVPPRLRRQALGASFVLLVPIHLAFGYSIVMALGFSASTVVSAYVARALVRRGLEPGSRAQLFEDGDVSTMIGACAGAATVAAAGYGGIDVLTSAGNPWLGALAAWGATAAALMVLMPLFLRTPGYAPIANRRERLVQAVITLGTTVATFWTPDFPPMIFAVMPMFAWHAYRGTLREATLLLSSVGLIAGGFTSLGLGPVAGLREHYGIPVEIAGAVFQLFLLDCGLILLPLSVMLTQQRMATARAAKERATLERLVHAATGTAVIATNAYGRITLMNPAAERNLGVSTAEVLGTTPDAFFSKEEIARQAAELSCDPDFTSIVHALIAVGSGSRLWHVERPDGTERTLRMTLTALMDDFGRPEGFLATGEDVTEREAAHQALLSSLDHERKAVAQLRELERVQSEFVATVSHELRTPITSIMGYLEVLEDGGYGDLNDGQLQVLGRVDRNSQRLLDLVEDLLTLAKIDKSSLEVSSEDSDLRDVVASARTALEPHLAGRSLQVLVSAPDFPAPFLGHARQLQRMVLNLLTNAVKFTPDGGAVELVLRDDGELYEIAVRDTGVGISTPDQEQLFERFFRAQTAWTDAIQGTGLGLTIVHAIVVQHGGSITVDSSLGCGATFTIRLPKVLPAALAVPDPVSQIPA